MMSEERKLAREQIDKAATRYMLMEVALHKLLEIPSLPPAAHRLIRETLQKMDQV